MSSSRRTQLVRYWNFGEVGVQRMDPPVANWKKNRPTVAIYVAGGSKGRSISPVAQEMGLIKNLNPTSMAAEEEDSESSIFTLELPNFEENGDGDNQSADHSFGAFLRTCSFCKKRITKDMDVFMYGYLKAFCSPECRDVQIEMDESLRPPSPQPTLLSTIAKMVGASNVAKMTSSKQGLGSNVNNHSFSIFD